MKLQDVSRLIDLWDRDEDDFRRRIRRDPKRTIEGHGIEVTEDEEAAIKQTDWTLPDEQLEAVLAHQP